MGRNKGGFGEISGVKPSDRIRNTRCLISSSGAAAGDREYSKPDRRRVKFKGWNGKTGEGEGDQTACLGSKEVKGGPHV